MAVEVDPIDGIDAAGNETPQSALDELLGPDRTDEDTAWRLYYCHWCALQAHDCDEDSSDGWDVSIAADGDARTAIAKTAREIFSRVDVEEACWVFPLERPGECLYEATPLSWGSLPMELYSSLPNPYMSEDNFKEAALDNDPDKRGRFSLTGGWKGSPERGFKINRALRKIKLSFGAVTESAFYHLRQLMRGVDDEEGNTVTTGLCQRAFDDSGLKDCVVEIIESSKISEDLYQRTCQAAYETLIQIRDGAADDGYPVSEYSPFQFENYAGTNPTEQKINLINRVVLLQEAAPGVMSIFEDQGTPCNCLAMDMLSESGDEEASKWVGWGD